MLKAHTSGIGQIVSGAQGEDTLVEQLKGEEGGTSRGGGTAGAGTASNKAWTWAAGGTAGFVCA